ncbi:MAG: DUF3152 domain-containing protein [Jatrophihabitantaceae bacterium]
MTRPSAQPRERNSAGGSSAGGPAGPGRGARNRWRAFAGRYGWRAYALPLLTAVSLVAIFNISTHRDPSPVRAGASAPAPQSTVATPQSSRPTAASSRSTTGKPATSSPAPTPTPTPTPLSPLALPAGAAYSMTGQGSFSTIPGSSGVLGRGQLYRFTIDVENGISGADPQVFAAAVMSALSDQRSWIATDAVALQRVDSGPVDFRVSLTAPLTVRPLCGYSLRMETSCYAGGAGRVVLNLSRWVRGAQVFGDDLTNYRRYLVNHEVGHAVGHNHAHYCLANGLAPIMMQQTIGTKTDNGQCRVNSWPFPAGVPDAPGAEQAGDGADAAFFQRNSS